MSTRAFALVLLPTLVLAACGGAAATPDSSSAPAPSSSPAPGIYHLDQVDATNLEIYPDGTYAWSIEGCDFGGGQCGAWKPNQVGNLVLSAGSADLEWSYGGSFRQKLASAMVVKKGDDLEVVGETDDGERFTQTWRRGRSCAVCGDTASGSLGPVGQQECDEPLPSICVR
jgi:hypothetical protein